ncbi:hypothetical protein NSQ59_22025 [Margalitia sp. FSL K6-0131]|uniref:hypothetical protein n=1 Tax=Margalitia sp. FSL K6-0131 TaxID=2954604 RepID=UPI0030F92734
MNLLSDLNQILGTLGLPIETGVFSGVPPNEYLVITPLTDTFEVFADNRPHHEIQEARLSLFIKGNYIARKNQVVKVLLAADFTITERRYIGHEDDTGYHHYVIDVAKEYTVKEE